ncbi:MAG: YbhB/YbcL family Raf kinase inhibitor-like protein [Phenylobacterium sp.]
MRLAVCVTALALVCASPALAAMSLTSPDLTPGGAMPVQHIYPRCGGQNVSPELAWSGAPAGTRSLALTMIDMDVKPALWSHWIVVDLPPTAAGLPRGVKALPAPAHAIVSNFGEAAYDGPCPPPGSGVHHYQFTIWAMKAPSVSLPADAKAPEVIATLTAGSLAKASLTVSVAAKAR